MTSIQAKNNRHITASCKPKPLPTREELHRTFGGIIYEHDLDPESAAYMAELSKRISNDKNFDKLCRKKQQFNATDNMNNKGENYGE